MHRTSIVGCSTPLDYVDAYYHFISVNISRQIYLDSYLHFLLSYLVIHKHQTKYFLHILTINSYHILFSIVV